MEKKTVAETEKIIRQKLEETGQLQKMRAMVVEASLKALTNEAGAADELFTPSKNLKQLKQTADGVRLFEIVADFLHFAGLTYTAHVMAMEADMKLPTISRADVAKSLKFNAAESVDQPLLKSLLIHISHQAETAPHLDTNKPSLTCSAVSSDINAKVKVDTTTAALPPAAKKTSVADAVASVLNKSGGNADATSGGSETLYTISKFQGKTFHRLNQVAGQQVNLDYLKDCNVFVLDPLDSMNMDFCSGGAVVLAAVEGSLFIRNCHNMVITACCKQLRTRDCSNIELRLFASTNPVVESSHHITFLPFNARLPKLIQSMKAARLDAASNRFVHVYDFTADDASIPQPHFTVQHPNHGLIMVDLCCEHGTPEAPAELEGLLLGTIQPAASSESGANKSHNIKTGAAAWNQQQQQQTAAITPSQSKSVSAPVVVAASSKGKSLPPLSSTTPAAKTVASTNSSGATTIPVPTTTVAAKTTTTTAPVVAPVSSVKPPLPKPVQEEEKYDSFEDDSDTKSDKYAVDEDEDTF